MMSQNYIISVILSWFVYDNKWTLPSFGACASYAGQGLLLRFYAGVSAFSMLRMAEEGSAGLVSSALSSLWSASSDKDDTCRTWGLVS